MDKELTGKAGKPGSKKEKKDHQPKDPSSNEPHKEKERPRDKSKQKKAGAEGKHIKKSTGQSVRGSELGTGDGKPKFSNPAAAATEDDAQTIVVETIEEFLGIAAGICAERFYHEHAPTLLCLNLRDTWLRIVEMEWLDADMKRRNDDNLVPQAVFMPDIPPLPLNYDSWCRGGLEELPREKRESILDPFLRDYSKIAHHKGSSLLRFQQGNYEMNWIDGYRLFGSDEQLEAQEFLEDVEETGKPVEINSKIKDDKTTQTNPNKNALFSSKSESRLAKRKQPKTDKTPKKTLRDRKDRTKTISKSATGVSKSERKSKKLKEKKRSQPPAPIESTESISLGVGEKVADKDLENEPSEMFENNGDGDMGGFSEIKANFQDTGDSRFQNVFAGEEDENFQEDGLFGEEELQEKWDQEEEQGDETMFSQILPPYSIDKDNSTSNLVPSEKALQSIMEPRRLESKSSQDIGLHYYRALGLKPWTPDDCGVWTGMGHGIFRLPRQTTVEALRLAKMKSTYRSGQTSVGVGTSPDEVPLDDLELRKLGDSRANQGEEEDNESTASAKMTTSRLEFYSDSRAEFIRQSKPSILKTPVLRTKVHLTHSEKDFFDHKMHLYRLKLQRQTSHVKESRSLPSQQKLKEPMPKKELSPKDTPKIVPRMKPVLNAQIQPKISLASIPVPPPIRHHGLPRNSDSSNLDIELAQFKKPEEQYVARLAAKGIIVPDSQFQSQDFKRKTLNILERHSHFLSEDQRHATKMYEDKRALEIRKSRAKSIKPHE